jgi:hypothetical protein
VVAAGGDHIVRGAIRGASNHFSDEVCLPGCDHVPNTWNRVKHLAYLLVSNSVLLDLAYQNLKDSTDAVMQEDLKLVELGLAKGPCFSSPEE